MSDERASPVSPAASAATDATHALGVAALSFSYGASTILDAVSMEVRSGEIVGLLGPNGSGKTTLLRCLLGFLAPISGRVTLDGLDVSSYPRRVFARAVACVAQETPVDVPLRVAELVLLGRLPHLPASGFGFESAADRALVRQALDDCGVLALADRLLHQLSGGELRRVFLARALVQRAPVLLLDEPTSGLDLRHRLAITAILERQAAGGTAVLAVLHDINLAAELCDRIVLLKAGKVVAQGSPAEVLTPTHVAVAYDVEVDALSVVAPPGGAGAGPDEPRRIMLPPRRRRDRLGAPKG